MYRVSHNFLGGGHRDSARFKYHVLYIKLKVFQFRIDPATAGSYDIEQQRVIDRIKCISFQKQKVQEQLSH